MTLDEFMDLVSDLGIHPDIAVSAEPPLQRVRISILFGHNPNCHFGGALVIWSVECNCSDRIAPKTTTGPFLQGRI